MAAAADPGYASAPVRFRKPQTPAFCESSSPLRSRFCVGASLCAGAAAVVLGLGAAAYADSAISRLDLAIVRILHGLGSERVTAIATGITDFGSTKNILLVTVVAVGALLLRGYSHAAVSVAVSVTATQAVVHGIKAIVERGRPPASSSFVDAAGYAFPSAHAASGVALYGLLALFVVRRLRGQARVAACALALLGLGSLGLTRVYLGAHYPTDVVAGWLVGALIAAGAWSLGRALRGSLPRLSAA
jgi:undecaprenyl-diphosphatase